MDPGSNPNSSHDMNTILICYIQGTSGYLVFTASSDHLILLYVGSGINHNVDELLVGVFTQISLRQHHHSPHASNGGGGSKVTREGGG